MIRITQQTYDSKTAGQLESLHAAFVRIIANKLPPSVAALYAQPKAAADGTVQWMTPLNGQPRTYAELSASEAGRLKTLLFERLSALRQYGQAMSQQAGHDVAAIELLKHASAEPPLEAIYSVNGQPVLLYWDRALPPDPKRRVLAAPIVPMAAAMGASARSVWWIRMRWLLALLLFLVIVFLLWWFFCPKSWRLIDVDQTRAPGASALSPPRVSQTAPPLSLPPPELLKPAETEKPTEPPVVRKPVDPPVPPEDATPPLVEVPEPEAELLRPRPVVPEPVAAIEAPPKPEVVPPKVTTPVKPPVPKTITIDNAKDVCPEDRPAALAPEMIVVFDASGSMKININATEAEQAWLFKVLNAGPNALSRLSPSDRQKFLRLVAEPTRRSWGLVPALLGGAAVWVVLVWGWAV